MLFTLSSADAAVHMTENPLFPKVLQHHDLAVTLVLISVLAMLFLRGFHEAIGISVVLVIVYLLLNFIVAVRCLYEVFRHPDLIGSWTNALFVSHGSWTTMIIPRYLPRYGMSPSWVNAIRPLVLFNTAIAFVVTIWFNASVDAQAGAYATGVLFLMTAAAFTVTLSAWRRGQRGAAAGFALIFLIFSYTTIDNIIERPDGMRIAAFFIAMTVIASLASRFWRTTELRIEDVTLDDNARRFILEMQGGDIRIIANHPQTRDEAEYRAENIEKRSIHHLGFDERALILEVNVSDASEFIDVLSVEGVQVGPFRVLRAESSVIPNSIAALLLRIRDMTGKVPHVYFHWGDKHPAALLFNYLVLGQGDVGGMTREVLRQAEPNAARRPIVHVAG